MSETYETRGLRRILLGLWGFTKNSLGNFFSLEFLSLFIPLLILWELLPRWNILPESLIPPLSVVAQKFWDMLLHRDLVYHIAYSMGPYGFQRRGCACRTHRASHEKPDGYGKRNRGAESRKEAPHAVRYVIHQIAVEQHIPEFLGNDAQGRNKTFGQDIPAGKKFP